VKRNAALMAGAIKTEKGEALTYAMNALA